MKDSSFLLQIAYILIGTKTFGILTRRFHMPQVVGALLAGVILGPICLNLVISTEMLNVFAEIGVILLMFNAGIETDIKLLREAFKASFLIAMLGVLTPIGMGFALSYFFFDMTMMDALFLGVILSATSVSITVETLNEMGKLKTKSGTAIVGAAVIDDVLGIIVLSMMLNFGSSSGGSVLASVGKSLLMIGLFLLIAAAVGFAFRRSIDWMSKRYKHTRRLPVFSLAFCFFFSWLAQVMGIADITGAYIAGLVLCNLSVADYVETKSTVLSYMIFSPVFFASIGLKTTVAGLGGTMLIFTIAYFLVAAVSKVIGCGVGALLCKFDKRESLQVGIGMVSRGEVALVMANAGMSVGIFQPAYFTPVVILVILGSIISPILLKKAF